MAQEKLSTASDLTSNEREEFETLKKFLLRDGDTKDQHNQTQLYRAATKRNTSVVRTLLNIPGFIERHGRYDGFKKIFHLTLTEGYDDIVALFIETGIDLNQKYDWRETETALFIAVEHRKTATVKVLLQHHARIKIKDAAFFLAEARGYKNILELFANIGIKPHLKNKKGLSALHIAVIKRDIALIQTFLKRRNNEPFPIDFDENTPLHLAAQRGDADIVKLFLEAGIDPNLKNIDGETALHMAVKAGHASVVDCLLQHRADSVQMQAAASELEEKKSAVDVNAGSNTGDTALHIAARTANTEIAALLRAAKADIGVTNSKGEKPLLHALKAMPLLAQYPYRASSCFFKRPWAETITVENLPLLSVDDGDWKESWRKQYLNEIEPEQSRAAIRQQREKNSANDNIALPEEIELKVLNRRFR